MKESDFGIAEIIQSALKVSPVFFKHHARAEMSGEETGKLKETSLSD